MEKKNYFKRCPSCFTEWRSREEFLSDSKLELIGYKVDFQQVEAGLFFFTHKKEECSFTIKMEAREFVDLYDGPRYPENKAESSECPRYCLDENNLEQCNVTCEYSFVREIINKIREKHRSQEV